jgi:hypothetical protein
VGGEAHVGQKQKKKKKTRTLDGIELRPGGPPPLVFNCVGELILISGGV